MGSMEEMNVEVKRFLPTWFASSVALAFAALIMGSKMTIGDSNESTLNRVVALAVVGLIFTIVHWFLGTFIKILSIPFIIVTLGFMLLVINAGLLLLTEWITSGFGVHLYVAGFWWAVLASMVISIFQSIVSALISQ